MGLISILTCFLTIVAIKYLVHDFIKDAHSIAADLGADMLEIARRQIQAHNLCYDVVIMIKIPYIDEQFDLVICQVSLMRVGENKKTLGEIHRF